MSGSYDTAQICLNGHIVNDSSQARSEMNKDFCTKCGEKTITTCQNCEANIKGAQYEDWEAERPLRTPPSYCHACGKPYPWTEKKIKTAIRIFAEFGDLDEEEKKTINKDIENIAKDVPESELSALRVKKLWNKYGKIAYNVIMEFASKTAAEILKSP